MVCLVRRIVWRREVNYLMPRLNPLRIPKISFCNAAVKMRPELLCQMNPNPPLDKADVDPCRKIKSSNPSIAFGHDIISPNVGTVPSAKMVQPSSGRISGLV